MQHCVYISQNYEWKRIWLRTRKLDTSYGYISCRNECYYPVVWRYRINFVVHFPTYIEHSMLDPVTYAGKRYDHIISTYKKLFVVYSRVVIYEFSEPV